MGGAIGNGVGGGVRHLVVIVDRFCAGVLAMVIAAISREEQPCIGSPICR